MSSPRTTSERSRASSPRRRCSTDYILTVAVSVAAGIVAITSAAPSLHPYRVWLCLACIVALTVANLRGVREAGFLFAIPTYGFVLSLFA